LFNKQLAGGSGQFPAPDFLSTSSEPDSDFKASL